MPSRLLHEPHGYAIPPQIPQDGRRWMTRLTCAQILPSGRRTLYAVPTLANHVELQQKGVPGLLTPKGFQIAYTDYQQHMIDELNESTAGNALHHCAS